MPFVQINNFKEKTQKYSCFCVQSSKKVLSAFKGEGTQRFLREAGEILKNRYLLLCQVTIVFTPYFNSEPRRHGGIRNFSYEGLIDPRLGRLMRSLFEQIRPSSLQEELRHFC